MQKANVPGAAGGWLGSLEASAFDVPAYRSAYEVLLAVGPPDDESDARWIERVLAEAPESLRMLLRALAVEPLPVITGPASDDEGAARYAISLMARLLDRDAARRLDGLSAQLSQPQAADAQVRRRLQEQYRAIAALRQQLQPIITSEVGS